MTGELGSSSEVIGAPAAVCETHVSTVFFVGDRVYKLKKPVKLDFLDFSTRAARARVCAREVELNRRMAPDVYLGVIDVHGVDGSVCDHLVMMRRMPDQRRLSTLVARGENVDGCVRAVAKAVAAFHAQAETSSRIAQSGSVDAVRSNWMASLQTMRPFVGSVLDPEVAGPVEVMASRYLDGRRPLFAARITQGKVRDGHGDLLADDIFCLEDGPRILDCIEFDDRLRYGDVLADIGFLAMDLERVAGVELGSRLLAWYREFAAETYPETLAHHYVAYRAQVRAMVACLRVGQGDLASGDQATRLLDIAYDHLRRGRVTLTLVGGLPGTGKSTLAMGLADRLGWTVLRSDEVRKDMAGLGHDSRPQDGFGRGLYSEAATAATYQTMFARARRLLELGEPVILDASWNSQKWRDQASAVARETSSDLVELRCEVAVGTARRRLAARARLGRDPSDATPDVADRMAATADPWPTATRIDTAAVPSTVLTNAVSVLTSD